MSAFQEGRQAVRDEIASGDIYDVGAVLVSFKNDPPDSEFQWGYFSMLFELVDAETRH